MDWSWIKSGLGNADSFLWLRASSRQHISMYLLDYLANWGASTRMIQITGIDTAYVLNHKDGQVFWEFTQFESEFQLVSIKLLKGLITPHLQEFRQQGLLSGIYTNERLTLRLLAEIASFLLTPFSFYTFSIQTCILHRVIKRDLLWAYWQV